MLGLYHESQGLVSAAVGSARASYQGEPGLAGRRLGFVFEYKK